MDNTSSIEFDFKGNLAQLQRDLRQASRLAQQAARETGQATQKGFEGGIAGFFRRTPERRAERAFSGLFTDLATGNIAQGVASFGEKLSGLGLAAGIGVGVAIGLFQKFRGEIKETEKATGALRAQLSKPLDLLGKLGPEALTGELEALNKASDDLAEKQKSIGSQVGEFLRRQKQFRPGGRLGTELITEPETPTPNPADIAQNQALQRGKELSEARANAELRMANIRLQGVTASEKDAALAKLSADAEARRSKLFLERGLTKPGRDQLDLFKAITAINVEEKAGRIEIEKKAALKERELDIDQDIAAQALRGVSAEDQKISKLQQELALIQEQLSGSRALTSENRKQLETSQAKTMAELALARAQASGRPLLSERDVHERAKLGLEEIAAGPGQQSRIPINLADEIRFGEQAKQLGSTGIARQALRDEALARQAASQGNLPLAEKLREMADKLKENIPELKSSEKPATMAEVLKAAQEGPSLKDIKSQNVMEQALLIAGKGPEIVAAINELKAKMDSYWGN